jgi:excisionase family DNA binding protein
MQTWSALVAASSGRGTISKKLVPICLNWRECTLDRNELEDSFMTVAEVAETLKLNQQTVRNWIDQGSLPAIRVGRRVRIRRSDFDRLLEQGYTSGGESAQDASAPSAADFWGGEPVGVAEQNAPSAEQSDGRRP